jgi:excisionase family DNA binding protein
MDTEILDVAEIAKYLKLSTKKVYQLVKSREIPFKKIGGQYRFVRSDIDKWISQELPANELHEDKNSYSAASEPKELLKAASGIHDKLKRQLYIVAVISKELAKYKVKPVIVGGFAVEFYTMGGYNTADIDLVFADSELLGKVLLGFGFIKAGRHWIHKELDVYIEAPGSQLTKGESEHLAEVEIKGLSVYLLGVEDLIIDRLNALVHWKSTDERNWIKDLMLINYDKIDWAYVDGRSKEEKTESALLELKAEIKNAKNKL